VSRALGPAYDCRNDWLTAGRTDPARLQEAKAAFDRAPIEALIRIYAARVRSTGERGVLSAIHQKLWLQYEELRRFLRNAAGDSPSDGIRIPPA